MKNLELQNIIEKINLGLNFLGYHVVINGENSSQIDIYNKDNEFVCSKIIELKEHGFVMLFCDNKGCNIKYELRTDDNFKHYFTSYNKLENSIDYSHFYNIVLTYDSENKDLVSINVETAKDDVIRRMEVSDSYFNLDLCYLYNYHVLCGRRFLEYKFPKTHRENSRFIMLESASGELYCKQRILNGNPSWYFKDSSNRILSLEEIDQFNMLSVNILRHPRNKELFNKILDDYNSQMPGLKNFITDNCGIYDYITLFKYIPFGTIDKMIKGTIVKKCDLENLDALLTKAKKYDSKQETRTR
ncbi:MAG: hypothetical protein J5634_00600 [Bacilli bacterium]|nr:hypothetical protein [Bacilli bacterium]